MDPGYAIGIYVSIALSFIMSLFVLNWTLTFCKLWTLFDSHLHSISIRRPKAVIFFNILCVIGMLRLWSALYLSLDEELKLFHQLYIMQSTLMHCTILAVMYIIVYRSWLVYFDIKFNQALSAAKWQSQIDTLTLKPSWFIQHRRKYGKATKVRMALFIPWCTFTIIGTISILFKGRNPIALLCYALNMIIPTILLIILLCKMPHYDDHYKLRQETRIESITGILCTVTIVMFLAVGIEPGQWEYIAAQSMQILALFIWPVISLYWILTQFRLPVVFWKVAVYKVCLDAKVQRSISSVSISVESVQNGEDKFKAVQMKDVFKDDELFHLFTTQLSKEFCVENMLFFVETHQFSQYLVRKYPNVLQSGVDLDLTAENIPKSTIVNDLDNDSSLNEAVIHLFQKYIDFEDAYFCVNISFEVREALHALVGYSFLNKKADDETNKAQMNSFIEENNITAQQIYDAFHGARRGVYRLLESRLLTFKSTRL